jgi:hypothetical protein
VIEVETVADDIILIVVGERSLECSVQDGGYPSARHFGQQLANPSEMNSSG